MVMRHEGWVCAPEWRIADKELVQPRREGLSRALLKEQVGYNKSAATTFDTQDSTSTAKIELDSTPQE